MSRTLIDLDDALLAEAQEHLGTSTKVATVHAALLAAVKLARRRGWRTRSPPGSSTFSTRTAPPHATSREREMEVPHGARDADEADRLQRLLAGFDHLPFPDEAWDRAKDVRRLTVGKGFHRALSMADLLVAATAERHGVAVLHYDGDCDMIAAVTGQPTRWVALAGRPTDRTPPSARPRIRLRSPLLVAPPAAPRGVWSGRAARCVGVRRFGVGGVATLAKMSG
ncbi:PIN domain-containing protein (plasmid) [Embleya sp. NBC_00888]|uniref:PIN domain-containing protein n=1 Tax=Embleya sp. NBC_00888 TaxID=2975960 RepID=UPI002F90EC72|nr:PIN domain-containing protein [Embleya sp. NBC_00888]